VCWKKFSLSLSLPLPHYNWKVNHISIYKPDRCCLLTFLPEKQKALFSVSGSVDWELGRAPCQVMETLLALILLPRTKPSYCLRERLKVSLIGIVLIFQKPQTRGIL
jgi:hypothetical protein